MYQLLPIGNYKSCNLRLQLYSLILKNKADGIGSVPLFHNTTGIHCKIDIKTLSFYQRKLYAIDAGHNFNSFADFELFCRLCVWCDIGSPILCVCYKARFCPRGFFYIFYLCIINGCVLTF